MVWTWRGPYVHEPPIARLVSVSIDAAMYSVAKADYRYFFLHRPQFLGLAHTVVIPVTPEKEFGQQRVIGID